MIELFGCVVDVIDDFFVVEDGFYVGYEVGFVIEEYVVE